MGRVCKKCSIEKNLEDFKKSKACSLGYRYTCKKCTNILNKKFFVDKEKRLESPRRYHRNNKEKIKILVKKRIEKDIDRHREKRNLYERTKRKNDLLFRLMGSARARIRGSIKEKGFRKNTKAINLLGCKADILKTHLELKFKDGMNWENYGKWHIDHIIPLASAKTEEEIYKLCHYTNLQPLWAIDNQSKSDKIITNVV